MTSSGLRLKSRPTVCFEAEWTVTEAGPGCGNPGPSMRGQQTPGMPRDYLIEATDWHRHALPFQPGKASSYYGYGYQFWTFPGARRRFALTGVFGQLLYVDPQLRLVMVQTAADASASAAALTRDADALWRALVVHFGGAW